ncbi:MAG: hypothetical protein CMO55_14435 [Verrucomicrobiales bacterium]|nr:hypothetical protein [Verrucomicrobiales bacterium]
MDFLKTPAGRAGVGLLAVVLVFGVILRPGRWSGEVSKISETTVRSEAVEAEMLPGETLTRSQLPPAKIVSSSEEEPDPVVTNEQKEKAFGQLQALMASEEGGQGVDALLPEGVLARFESFGGENRKWDEADFAIRTDDDGNTVAPNPAQGMYASFADFESKGVRIESAYGAPDVHVKLASIGHGSGGRGSVGRPKIQEVEDPTRVEYSRGGGIYEWYINGENGLEQGWTIEAPLPGAGSGRELRLGIEIETEGAVARLREENRGGGPRKNSLVFSDAQGREVWSYGKLEVFDSTGATVPSWMERRFDDESQKDSVVFDLVVAVGGREYPLTVDPQISSELAHFSASSHSSSPSDLVEFQGKVFFYASTKTFGREIWCSDGTVAGTRLLKDVTLESSDVTTLTVFDDKLFFTEDGELWVSDGTSEGTEPFFDIIPNALRSFTNLTEAGGLLYFVGRDSPNGSELWATDGTSEGTYLVKDIFPGSSSSLPEHLIEFDGKLFFSARDGTNGKELWVTDGTDEGTSMVKDIYTGGGYSLITEVAEAGGKLFLVARHPDHGYELWVSDGTATGTVLVTDIYQGSTDSSPSYLTEMGGKLYFRATDSMHGTELWVSDGTESGTQLVKDIFAGNSHGSPTDLFRVANIVFFRANDGESGVEVWKTDGTEGGTELVKDINPGVATSNPQGFGVLNGLLYFGALDGIDIQLWVSDGTEEGTHAVEEIGPYYPLTWPEEFIMVGGKLFFSGISGYTDRELWVTDGTPEGTKVVKDIYPSDESALLNGRMTVFEGRVFFEVDDGIHGHEPWVSDGTVEGTHILKDIYPGPGSSGYRYYEGTSFTEAGGKLFFVANDGVHGHELWATDGTETGTVLVKDIRPGMGGTPIEYFVEVEGKLLFSAHDNVHGRESWISDGTEAGTTMLKDFTPGNNYSGFEQSVKVGRKALFFARDDLHGGELWCTDGTPLGTQIVKDIRPGPVSSFARDLVSAGGRLYFRANDGSSLEYWISDGTTGGTLPLDEVNAAFTFTNGAEPIIQVGDLLFFQGYDGAHGFELWVSDGTEVGTHMLKDINPGNYHSLPQNFVEVGGRLFFVAYDEVNGFEMWVSDGTEEGTTLTKDIYPGDDSNLPHGAAEGNCKLYFQAKDGVNGAELWVSDGSEDGTYLLEDVATGPESSWPDDIVSIGYTLLFTTANPEGGRDLRSLSLVPPPKINEFDPTTSEDTDLEFLEIASDCSAHAPLDGYTVVFYDGETDASYLAIDLGGQSRGENGYFVIGNAGVPNVDMVIPNESFEVDVGAVAIYKGDAASYPPGTAVTTENLVDAIVYGTSGQSTDVGLLTLISEGQPQINESRYGVPEAHSFQRFPDIDGEVFETGIFELLPPTPGFPNGIPVAPYQLDVTEDSDTGESRQDNVTRISTPTITGLCHPRGTVNLISSLAGNIGSAVADRTGFWTIETESLEDGTHEITATSDGSAPSEPISVAVDTVPPATPSSPILESDTGVLSDDNLTKDNSPGFSGTAEIANISLFADYARVAEGASDGAWNLTSYDLLDGEYLFTAIASDLAGNWSDPSGVVAVTIDSTPPELTIEKSMGQGDPVSSGPILFSAVFSEEVFGFDETKVSIGGTGAGSYVVSGGPSEFLINVSAAASEGHISVSADAGAAMDLAGNMSLDPVLVGNSVTLDSIGSDGGSATALDVTSGAAVVDGWIDPADTDVFSFTLASTKIVEIKTTGEVDTRGVLTTYEGSVVNDPEADMSGKDDSNFFIVEVLPPGDYLIFVTSEGAANTGAYQLSVEVKDPTAFINEVDVFTQQSDSLEFIELYDAGQGNTSLDGHCLVLYDSDTNTSFYTVDLDGYSTDEDGYFLIGNSDVSGVGLIFPDRMLPDNGLGVALYEGDGADFLEGTPATVEGLLDAVFVENFTEGSPGLQSLLYSYSTELRLDEDSLLNGRGHSLQRFPNGRGGLRTNENFIPISPTPGEPNLIPSPPTGLDLSSDSDTGKSQTDDITSEATPLITGISRPGAQILLIESTDGSVGSGVAGIDGKWSIETALLTEGTKSITAAADGGEESSPLVFELDLTAPAAPTGLDLDAGSDSNIPDDNITSDITPTFSGTSVESHSVKLYANSFEVGSVQGDGVWMITSSGLTDGGYTVTASSCDAAGNESTASSPVNLVVDTTPPTVTISRALGQIDPAVSGPVSFAASFSEVVSGFDSRDVVTSGPFVGGVSILGGSASYIISVESSGEGGFVAISIPGAAAIDTAGNASSASVSIDSRIDLDIHSDTIPGATPLVFSNGTGQVTGYLHPGDSDRFAFTIASPVVIRVHSTGMVGGSGELYKTGDSAFQVIEGTSDNGDFELNATLVPGDYTLLLTSSDSDGSYVIDFEETGVPEIQPDLLVNGVGDGIYDTLQGQTISLVSKKARPVHATFTLTNDSEIQDSYTLRATPGNRLFQTVYLNRDDGNIAAGLVAGTHQVVDMIPGDSGYRIAARITPSKKRLRKKKIIRRGTRKIKKYKYLKKQFSSRITATSSLMDTKRDLNGIQLRTK